MSRDRTSLPVAYQENLRFISSLAGAVDFELIDRTSDLSMRLEGCTFGPVDVFRYEGNGLRSAKRSNRQIHLTPTDDFLALFPISKPIRLSQCRHDSIVEPGSMCLVSTGLPYELQGGEAPTYGYSELFVKIPAPLLRKKIPLIDRYCAIPIATERGACKVVKQLVESAFSERGELSGTNTRVVGDMLLDALSMISPHGVWTEPEEVCFNRQRSINATLTRARRFIDSNLSNPRLSMQMIAAHCHVSERKLYAAFASTGTTAGAYLRDSRLQRCRAELRDRRLSDESIIEVAMRWGYSNPASFSRAYRTKFGCSPRMERNG